MAALTVNPSPPTDVAPEPVYVSFVPPLYLQRQSAVHTLVTRISNTPRFNGRISSLLDVGCGDVQFLRRLTPCDDHLPLTQLTGIDISDELWDKSLSDMLAPGGYFGTGKPEERWRALDVTLLHGSFEALSPAAVGTHDVIVSVEVIEHLDPGPLENYAPTLLGRMHPKICIITTPNRDYNALFDCIDPPPARELDKTGHYRPDVPYRMRHHDHRFEWNRREFREWAIAAAKRFDYDVAFYGVGGIGRGLTMGGGSDRNDGTQTLRDAAKSCDGHTSGQNLPRMDDTVCTWETLHELVKDSGDALTGWAAQVRQVFGDCSQIAVFVIKESAQVSTAGMRVPQCFDAWSSHLSGLTSNIRVVAHHHHPYNPLEIFPPTASKALEAAMDRRMADLVPRLVRDEWNKSAYTLALELRDRSQGTAAPPIAEPVVAPVASPVVQAASVISDDSTAYESECMARYLEEERLKLKGLQPWDIELVEVIADAEIVWEESVLLQRLCRFRFEIFRDLIFQSEMSYIQEQFNSAKLEPGEHRVVFDNRTSGIAEQDIPMVIEISHTEGQQSIGLVKVTFPVLENTISELALHPELGVEPELPSDGEAGTELTPGSGSICNGATVEEDFDSSNSDSKEPIQEEYDGSDYWAYWSRAGSCTSSPLSHFHSPYASRTDPQNMWLTEVEWFLPGVTPIARAREIFNNYLERTAGQTKTTLRTEQKRSPDDGLCMRIRFLRPQKEIIPPEDLPTEFPVTNWCWNDNDAPASWGVPSS